jgi:hypothetical protein
MDVEVRPERNIYRGHGPSREVEAIPITMNWAIAIVGGLIVLATVYYVAWGHKSYSPPCETVEDYIGRYEQESDESSAVTEEKTLVTGTVLDPAEKLD